MDHLTEYEKQRLENIQRNNAILAALEVDMLVEHLNVATATGKKRGPPKGYKRDREKRARLEPVVLRRSPRTKGVSPDSKGLDGEPIEASTRMNITPKDQGPLPMHTMLMSGCQTLETRGDFLSELLNLRLKQPEYDKLWRSRLDVDSWAEVPAPARILSLNLEADAVARIVPERIFTVTFLHVKGRIIAAAGDKAGHVGFWNTDRSGDEGDGVHLYQPHSAPVSGIASCPCDFTKLLTCSYDGFVRLMDVERATFDQIYWAPERLSCVAYAPSFPIVAYVGEGEGVTKVLDSRLPKHASSYGLHERRINSIDFHPHTPTMMTTGSTDGIAAIWDIRKLKLGGSESIAALSHDRAVHSAYYSPSGHHIATTSYDDHVRLWNHGQGGEQDEHVKVYHDNQTNRWSSSFRAIWGWDDNLVFIGNKKKSIDVISATTKAAIGNLTSDFMTSIPSRLACHPLSPGIIAGGSHGGHIYVWRG